MRGYLFSEMFLILQHIFWGTVNMNLKVADRSFLCTVSLFPSVTALGITTAFQTWKQGQFKGVQWFCTESEVIAEGNNHAIYCMLTASMVPHDLLCSYIHWVKWIWFQVACCLENRIWLTLYTWTVDVFSFIKCFGGRKMKPKIKWFCFNKYSIVVQLQWCYLCIYWSSYSNGFILITKYHLYSVPLEGQSCWKPNVNGFQTSDLLIRMSFEVFICTNFRMESIIKNFWGKKTSWWLITLFELVLNCS